jgi:hypothetical protein
MYDYIDVHVGEWAIRGAGKVRRVGDWKGAQNLIVNPATMSVNTQSLWNISLRPLVRRRNVIILHFPTFSYIFLHYPSRVRIVLIP